MISHACPVLLLTQAAMVAWHGVPGALPTGLGLVVVVGRTVVVVVVGGGVVVVVVGATVVVVVVVVVVALAEVLTGEAFDARSTPVEHAAISPATPTVASANTILFTRTEVSPATPNTTPITSNDATLYAGVAAGFPSVDNGWDSGWLRQRGQGLLVGQTAEVHRRVLT